jgi:hypothetical protein
MKLTTSPSLFFTGELRVLFSNTKVVIMIKPEHQPFITVVLIVQELPFRDEFIRAWTLPGK